MEAEFAGLLQASREKRLIEFQIPTGDGLQKGGIYHSYLQYRGLETAPKAKNTEQKRFYPDAGFAGLEWHSPEEHPGFGTIRWSGPALEATMVLPVIPPARFKLRIQIRNFFGISLADELRLFVNDDPVAYSIDDRQLIVESCPANGETVRIRFACTRTRCPYFEWPGKNEDQRWLGICLNWVEIGSLE